MWSADSAVYHCQPLQIPFDSWCCRNQRTLGNLSCLVVTLRDSYCSQRRLVWGNYSWRPFAGSPDLPWTDWGHYWLLHRISHVWAEYLSWVWVVIVCRIDRADAGSFWTYQPGLEVEWRSHWIPYDQWTQAIHASDLGSEEIPYLSGRYWLMLSF